MTEEYTSEIASKWMEIADTDESGTIDFDEFKDMISKLDDKQDDDSLKTLFDAQDNNGNGELTVEQFGIALYGSVKLMKHDEEGQEDN